MSMQSLESFIMQFVRQEVAAASTETGYRQPLVGFASAADGRFAALRQLVAPSHLLPSDLLPTARSVVSYFLPFEADIVRANRAHRQQVAVEWSVAYVETNELIDAVAQRLIVALGQRRIAAAAEKATYNWDPVTLVSWWSHKSVGVIAGLASFGLHHMAITEAGCAGRFGSVVVDAELAPTSVHGDAMPARCRYLDDGSCTACVQRCPVGALTTEGLDKQLCYARCLEVAEEYRHLGVVEVCGKCATGPCALRSGVQ